MFLGSKKIALARKPTELNISDRNSAVVRVDERNVALSISTAEGVIRANKSRPRGKFYCEFSIRVKTGGNNTGLGITQAAQSLTASPYNNPAYSMIIFGDGLTYVATGGLGSGGAWAAGDVVSMAINIDAKTFWFRVNGGNWNANATYDPAAGVGGYSFVNANAGDGPWFPYVVLSTSADKIEANFGGKAYSYPPPSGFRNW